MKKLDEPRPQYTFDLVLRAGQSWAGGDGSLNGMPVVTSGWGLVRQAECLEPVLGVTVMSQDREKGCGQPLGGVSISTERT